MGICHRIDHPHRNKQGRVQLAVLARLLDHDRQDGLAEAVRVSAAAGEGEDHRAWLVGLEAGIERDRGELDLPAAADVQFGLRVVLPAAPPSSIRPS